MSISACFLEFWTVSTAGEKNFPAPVASAERGFERDMSIAECFPFLTCGISTHPYPRPAG